MIEFLSSGLWNLFFLGCTLVMLGFADFSRCEPIQKTAAYIFGGFVIFNVFSSGPYAVHASFVIDGAGLAYAWHNWNADRAQRAPLWVANLFGVMLILHLTGAGTGMLYWVALNLLYLAQLIVLATYSYQAGRSARALLSNARNDPYYKVANFLWVRAAKVISSLNAG